MAASDRSHWSRSDRSTKDGSWTGTVSRASLGTRAASPGRVSRAINATCGVDATPEEIHGTAVYVAHVDAVTRVAAASDSRSEFKRTLCK
jgi:hypothetical protein